MSRKLMTACVLRGSSGYPLKGYDEHRIFFIQCDLSEVADGELAPIVRKLTGILP
jgi:hypothetical protein